MGTNEYAYAYDPIGNRTAATNNGEAAAYTANALNQYTNIVGGPASPPAYDADGNLLTNGVWSYTWDAENRIVSACSNNVLLVTNVYDHLSRRIRKEVYAYNDTTFNFEPVASNAFLYDGWNVLAETRCTPVRCDLYFYAWGPDLSGSLQGAGGVGGLLAVTTMGWEWDVSNSPEYFTYYPLYDANGNVVSYTENREGGTVASFEYDAFGRTISESVQPGLHLPHRFSTKYLDAETGLYYYGYRYYHPELGRWVSRDPIGERGGLNEVGFVDNDSVNMGDFAGLMAMPLPLLTLSAQIKEIEDALNRATAKVAPIFRKVTGFDTMRSRIGGAMYALKFVRFIMEGRSARNSRGGILWPSGQNQDLQEANAIHELGHAYRAQQGISLRTHIVREEGICYSLADVYYLSAIRFRALERTINMATENTRKRAFEDGWKFGWEELDYTKKTKEVVNGLNLLKGALGYPTGTPLSSSDWKNMEGAFGVDVSCKQIADAYNDKLKAKGVCYRFVCKKSSFSANEIATTVDIRDGQY